MKRLFSIILAIILLPQIYAPIQAAETVTIYPREYLRPLRNPLKGFTNRGRWEDNEWATLMHSYIKWNEIERDSLDDIPEIKDWCDNAWAGVEDKNIKVIPRVYLHWDGDDTYWPEDMETGDYTSDQFKRRLKTMIWKLGECWDGDPRVAHIEMGIIGKWGEHHSPSPSKEIEQILGEEFRSNFPNKKILVRHPWEFREFKFGIYWDSWAHYNQMQGHGQPIYNLGDRWKNEIIGGETAYNWGDWRIQPGDDPTDTMVDPEHRNFLIYTIRWLHCTQLRWVADYDQNNSAARAGAEEVQKTFGYRYVIDEVRYPSRIETGEDFTVFFSGRNTGSAPFYYDWPVELGLLNESGDVVWRATFKEVDIRTWMPGDKWNKSESKYTVPVEPFTAQGTFNIYDLPKGKYVLTLAVLDPSGMEPSLRFAIKNYFKGGCHPIGYIGIGTEVFPVEIDSTMFDDPYSDKSINYLYDPDLVGVLQKSKSVLPIKAKLGQNYPNPFNPSTTISFEIEKQSAVKLSVYNITGTQVRELVSDIIAPGRYSMIWDGTDNSGNRMASGLYFCRLECDHLIKTRKMILTR
ncbi:DUF4832 domain-containing protein [candidate division KSB1 bacterium]|nr:DUF4832 domain-containing protein [candidate division KSB1 bacterium]